MNTLQASMNDGASKVVSFVRAVCLVAITVAVTIFTLQNLATVDMRFLTWELTAPSAAIVLSIFAGGFVAGYLTRWMQPKA